MSRARELWSRRRTWMLLRAMPAPASIVVNSGPMKAAMISESMAFRVAEECERDRPRVEPSGGGTDLRLETADFSTGVHIHPQGPMIGKPQAWRIAADHRAELTAQQDVIELTERLRPAGRSGGTPAIGSR